VAAQKAFGLQEQAFPFTKEIDQKRWDERRKLVQEELKRIAGLGPS
jgi:hypothetical protein